MARCDARRRAWMTGWSVRWQSGSPSRSFHSGAQQSGGRSLLPRSQGKTAATNRGGYCCSHWRRNWIPSSDPLVVSPASAQDVQPAAGVDGKSVQHGRQVAGEVGDASGGRVVYLLHQAVKRVFGFGHDLGIAEGDDRNAVAGFESKVLRYWGSLSFLKKTRMANSTGIGQFSERYWLFHCEIREQM